MQIGRKYCTTGNQQMDKLDTFFKAEIVRLQKTQTIKEVFIAGKWFFVL